MCSVAHPASRRHADTVHAALPLTGESTVCALDDKKSDTTAQSGWWATVWPFRALAGSSCLLIMTIDLAAPSLPPPRGVGVSNTLQFAKNCMWGRTPPCDCGGGTAKRGPWAAVWPFRALAGSSCLPVRAIRPAAPSLPPPRSARGGKGGGTCTRTCVRAHAMHVHELWFTLSVLHARI